MSEVNIQPSALFGDRGFAIAWDYILTDRHSWVLGDRVGLEICLESTILDRSFRGQLKDCIAWEPSAIKIVISIAAGCVWQCRKMAENKLHLSETTD